eukprot:4194583-Amphidinium_carterae.1
MVAGRCRKSTSDVVKGSMDGFTRWYPNHPNPDHTDLEYYSFLRDKKYEYPQVWAVPEWFRAGTLLASAEQEEPQDLVIGGMIIPAFREPAPES